LIVRKQIFFRVDDFLDVTRIEQGRSKYDFVSCDVNKIIDSVVHEFKGRADEKGLKIEWEPGGQHYEAELDEEKIRHVVFNFIDNAIKYTENGSIFIKINEEDAGVAVRVRDRGLGFGRVDEANFFQKFYRGLNVKGTNVNGTGLGLYVCQIFITAHNGRIWAHSAGLGKGSEFGFWVPYKQNGAP